MVGLGERKTDRHTKNRGPVGLLQSLHYPFYSSRRGGRPIWQSKQKAKKANKKDPLKEQYYRSCTCLCHSTFSANKHATQRHETTPQQAGLKPRPVLSWQQSSIRYLVSILPSESWLHIWDSSSHGCGGLENSCSGCSVETHYQQQIK